MTGEYPHSLDAKGRLFIPARMREELGISGKKVIGHVGRFFPQKNHTFLIDIFKAIYKNRLTADVKADVKTSGTLDDIDMTGYIDVSNLSVVVDGKILPASSADIKLKGNMPIRLCIQP